jgi:hypothetical protein
MAAKPSETRKRSASRGNAIRLRTTDIEYTTSAQRGNLGANRIKCPAARTFRHIRDRFG